MNEWQAEPGAVLQVLQERAAELKNDGDDRLETEIQRAVWVVLAHQERQQKETMAKRIEELEGEKLHGEIEDALEEMTADPVKKK